MYIWRTLGFNRWYIFSVLWYIDPSCMYTILYIISSSASTSSRFSNTTTQFIAISIAGYVFDSDFSITNISSICGVACILSIQYYLVWNDDAEYRIWQSIFIIVVCTSTWLARSSAWEGRRSQVEWSCGTRTRAMNEVLKSNERTVYDATFYCEPPAHRPSVIIYSSFSSYFQHTIEQARAPVPASIPVFSRERKRALFFTLYPIFQFILRILTDFLNRKKCLYEI